MRTIRQAAPRERVLDLEALTPAGDGLGRWRDGVVSVPGAIPGERVRVRVAPAVRTRPAEPAEAELLEILWPSPYRVPARCAHAGACGGCTLQHLSYPEQLRSKQAMLDRLVRAAVPSAPPSRELIPTVPLDDPWHDRQKVHFVFGRARGSPLTIGHYARRSRTLVAERECPVHAEHGNMLAFRPEGPLRADAHRDRVLGTERRPQERGHPRRPPTSATVIVAANTDTRLRAATQQWLESDAAPTAFHISVHDGSDPFIFGRHTRRIRGAERLREEVAGLSFLISPASFFQQTSRRPTSS